MLKLFAKSVVGHINTLVHYKFDCAAGAYTWINIKEGGKVLKIEKQLTISAVFKVRQGGALGPIPLVKKSLVDKKLQEFIIRNVVPLSTVDGSGFDELIKACEPMFEISPSKLD